MTCFAGFAVHGTPPRERIQAAKDGSGFLVDGYNRLRIFRGFNDLQHYHSEDACRSKGTGPYIRNCNYLPHYLQNDSVILLLEEQGFNAMRTPMMWAAARPQENTTDVAYLKDSKTIVDKLAASNIYSLLDMHQDVLTSRFGHDYDGAPLWLVNKTQPRRPFPWPHKKISSWGQSYSTEAIGQCFQDIYKNVHGGLDEWSKFWQVVAQYFKQQSYVLGYELMNEPWAGDVIADPLLYLPGEAGRKNLMPSYKHVAASIRQVDNETAIFFEPVTWGMVMNGKVTGSGFTETPDKNSVLTYHYYCWFADSGDGSKPYSNLKKSDCDGSSNKLGLGPRVFKAIDKDRRDLQAPVFMSEWGGKSPQASQAHSKSFVEISEVMDLSDEYFSSWTFYDLVSIFTDASVPFSDREYDILRTFARPYAQAIAGVPTHMKADWDVDSDGHMKAGAFTLKYNINASAAPKPSGCPVCSCGQPILWPGSGCPDTCGAKCGSTCCCLPNVGKCGSKPEPPARPVIADAPTEIAVPPLWFPNGFTVEVSAGLFWKMAPGRRNIVAVWLNTTAGPAPASATVTITPK